MIWPSTSFDSTLSYLRVLRKSLFRPFSEYSRIDPLYLYVSNVKVHAPFKLDREEHATHFTNFDSTGRYLLILEKHNVVKEHEQPIQVTYLELLGIYTYIYSC